MTITLCQSFASISRATSDQLENLPGFGKTKVANMKNAFEKPFRKEESRTIPPRASHRRVADEPLISEAGEPSNVSARQQAPGRPPIREPSPEWDIEHEDPPAIGAGANQVFDIELDL